MAPDKLENGAQRAMNRGGTGFGVPESTPAGFCIFLSEPDPEYRSQKFVKKRTFIRSHFSILAVAGICVVIS